MTCLLLTLILDRKTCEEGGRRWVPARRWRLWRWGAGYFPVKLIKTCDLNDDKNYIFGLHPHGTLTYAVSFSFAAEGLEFDKLFPKLRAKVAVLSAVFWVPFQREVYLWLGLCSVTKKSLDWMLGGRAGVGNALVILPGGGSEALNSTPGTYKLVLKNRKGFIRMALKHGADLVPCLAFGENEVFSRVGAGNGVDENRNVIAKDIEKVISKFASLVHMGIPLIYGRGIFQYTFGLMPYRKQISTVVGKPINVTKTNGEPSQDQVDQLHALYCRELILLYEKHRHDYEHETIPMEIV